MFLTQIIDLPVRVSNVTRGKVKNACFSLKTGELKYLICAPTDEQTQADFTVTFSSVVSLEDDVTLKRLTPVIAKNCVSLPLFSPVYDEQAKLLGELTDAKIENGVVTELIIDYDKRYPAHLLLASKDVVILRKKPPYPIGQRVPAPVLLRFQQQKTPQSSADRVTKAFLKATIKKGELIKTTLALAPFYKNLF